MRILYLLHETGMYNGAWKSAHCLLHGLLSYGISIKIITPDKHDVYKILKNEGFDVSSVKMVWNDTTCEESVIYKLKRIPYDIRRVVLSIIWWFRLKRIISSFKPDIIHSNSSVFYLGYYLAKHYNIPHLWHIREFGKLDFNLKLYRTNKLIRSEYSYYICISQTVKTIRALSNNPNAYVIYNGILSKSYDVRVNKKQNYVLYVGSLGEGKGIKMILDAWLLFRKENKGLILKLAGGKTEEIKKWVRYIKLKGDNTEDIVFLGTQDDIFALMKHARALIMASSFEAFGRVTAESMFNKTLVIGRDTAGTKEQFDNGLYLTGLEIALRFNDSVELSNRLIELQNMTKSEYKLITERAFNTVNRLYSMENCTKQVVSLYKKILEK